MKDFREFLLRGNLVDTAVGIVIGLAFAAVVTRTRSRSCARSGTVPARRTS
jgi:large-conductance mechanosensitive channel